MRNVTGAVARGEDFFDRAGEVEQFWRELETDNLLVLAPRRVGKTSLLRRLEDTSGQHNFQAVFLDVSDCADELAFTQRLYTAILETTQGDRLWARIQHSGLGKVVSRIQKAGGYGFSVEFGGTAADWARLGEDLADALNGLDGRWLLEVDELPVFVLKLLGADGPTEGTRIREFLYWLRRLRLEYPKLRWILAGSIGLDTVSSRLNVSDAINDLRIASVGAFSEGVAHDLLQRLGESYGTSLDEAVRSRIVHRIGWLAPYYLQLVFKQIHHVARPSVEDVDRAIENLLQPQFKTHFDYWRQRLSMELSRIDAAHALVLVNTAARDGNGVTLATLSGALAPLIADAGQRQERLRYLLDVLVNDGYLVEQDQRYRFRFALLREYWLRHVAPLDREG